MASWFENVETAPPIEVFALTQAFNEDSNSDKVNLSVGAYRTNEGKPWVLPVVRTVEAQMAADQTLNHEYLPVAGFPDFRKGAIRLILGEDSPAISQNRVDSIQAIGGTGALRIGMDFLKSTLGCDVVYVSKPTWGNHKGIAKSLGYGSIKEYRYWDDANRSLDLNGMLEDLRNAPPRSVILLHMCAHNPSGIDPTKEQWQQIADVIKSKQLFPFFDCAYQGFSSGNLDQDATSLRQFVAQGFEVFAAQSFSKNFGLYNERVGNLLFVTSRPEQVAAVRSQAMMCVRQTWSNSPNHGARVVATVLNNKALSDDWRANVKLMADRILQMRKLLYEKLRELGTPGTWEHIITQTGMFSYTGLNKKQCEYLVGHYHIYLLNSGRINMCGLTTGNVEYVAKAINDVVVNIPADPKL
jgi:aspartate aminotransferase